MINLKDLSPETNYAAYLIISRTPRSRSQEIHHDSPINEQSDFSLSTLQQMMHIISKHYCNLSIDKSNGSICFLYREYPDGVWRGSRMREDGQWEIKLGNFSTCFEMAQGLSFYLFDDNTKLLKNETNCRRC